MVKVRNNNTASSQDENRTDNIPNTNTLLCCSSTCNPLHNDNEYYQLVFINSNNHKGIYIPFTDFNKVIEIQRYLLNQQTVEIRLRTLIILDSPVSSFFIEQCQSLGITLTSNLNLTLEPALNLGFYWNELIPESKLSIFLHKYFPILL